MKKIIALLTALIICMSCLAVNAETTGYTIQELQELAVKNSTQSALDDMDIRLRELDLKKVKTDSSVLNDMILLETRPMELAIDLEVTKMKKQDNIQSLKLNVYKQCMQILLADKQINAEDQKLGILKQRLELARARFKAQTIVEDEVKLAEYNIDSAQIDIDNIKAKRDCQLLDLKRLINLKPETGSIAINDTISAVEFAPAADLNSLIGSVIEKYTSVYEKGEYLKAKQKGMEKAKKLYTPDFSVYASCEISLESATLDNNDARAAVKVDIENKNNELLNKKDDLDLSAKYLALCKKKLDNADIKFKKGTLSKEALLAEKEKFLDAEYANYSAVCEYDILKAEFDSLIKK